MVLQQCLACNRMMPGSSKSCVCGHVFTQKKMIGDKRYSGYRAQLISRPYTTHESKHKENCGSEQALKTNHAKRSFIKSQIKNKSALKDRNGSSIDNHVIQKTARKKKSKPRQYKRCHPYHYEEDESCLDVMIPGFPNSKYTFSSALDEINKKLFSQSVMWMYLKAQS